MQYLRLPSDHSFTTLGSLIPILAVNFVDPPAGQATVLTFNILLGFQSPPLHDSYSYYPIATMAASIGHTFNSSCMLHQASNEFTRRASVASADPPKISAQYFYCSALPIDDPLSPVPPTSSNPANRSSKVPPRPFSVHDNTALEDGWLKLQKPVPSKKDAPGSRLNTTNVSPRNQEHIAQIIKDAHEKPIIEPGKTNSQGFEALDSMPENRNDMINRAIGNSAHPAGLGNEHRPANPDLTLCDDPEYIPFDETMPVSSEGIGNDEFESGVAGRKRSWSPFGRRDKLGKPKEQDTAVPTEPLSASTENAGEMKFSSSLPGRDTTGTPFLRIPSRIHRSRSRLRSRSPKPPHSAPQLGQADGAQSPERYNPKKSSPLRPTFQRSASSDSSDNEDGSRVDTSPRGKPLRRKQTEFQVPERARVTVGMLRLHVVHMPSLEVSVQSAFGIPPRAYLSNIDGAYILGSCPRCLVRYSRDLVFQGLNDAYRVWPCKPH